MFKRALQTNHWMAIGLDEWNKLENMELTPALIKKLRRVEKGEDVQDDEELENQSVSGESCQEESLGDEEESIDEESSDDEGRVYLRYCESCPGLKFLTEKDFQEHIKSKRHMKRIAKESSTLDEKPKVDNATPEKQQQTPSTPTANPNNRKARRAHLAALDKNRPN